CFWGDYEIMTVEKCIYNICFIPMNSSAPSFFGFSEFLASLAIIVLAWNIVDLRYQFRAYIAPYKQQQKSFVVVGIIGFLTLMSDFWRISELYVIKDSYISYGLMQLILAFCYLSVVFLWVNYSFISPQKFSEKNHMEFLEFISKVFISGDRKAISIVLDEMRRSSESIMYYSSYEEDIGEVKKAANTIIALMSDEDVCKVMAREQPLLFRDMFLSIYKLDKFNLNIGSLTINFVSSSLEYERSFVYRENDCFNSNYFSKMKPICTPVFNNYEIIDSYQGLITPDSDNSLWGQKTWGVYFSLLEMAIDSFVKYKFHHISPSFLHWPRFFIVRILSKKSLRLINQDVNYMHPFRKRIECLSAFVDNVILGIDDGNIHESHKFYVKDFIAQVVYEVIESAALDFNTATPDFLYIKKQLVWDELYNSTMLRDEKDRYIINKVNDKIYRKLLSLPNYDSVSVLMFVISVVGLKPIVEGPYGEIWRKMHIDTMCWCEENLKLMLDKYPRLLDELHKNNLRYDKEYAELYEVDDNGCVLATLELKKHNE
ncbi:hypothetical protein, partial [Vibrio atlanticus]